MSTAVQKKPRRKHYKRSLLMQMAAVGLTVIIVTNSFGEDVLGRDALFQPEAASPGQSQDTPVEESQTSSGGDVLSNISDSLIQNQLGWSSYLYIVRENGEVCSLIENGLPVDYTEPSDDAYYIDQENKLLLNNTNLREIYAQNMGSDFTICLYGLNAVDSIYIGGDNPDNSLRINGENGASLNVNDNQDYPFGLWLDGCGGNTCLAVDWGVDIEVYGTKHALLISETTAQSPLIYDSDIVFFSGDLTYLTNIQTQNGTKTGWVLESSFNRTPQGIRIYISSGRGGPGEFDYE